jgi:hypothetical protein
MFKLSNVGYVFVGESYGQDDLDSVVNAMGKILAAKMSFLYADRDYCITYFKGLPNYYLTKSAAFEVRTDLYDQGIGKTKFEITNSVDFPGGFDLKVRVARIETQPYVEGQPTARAVNNENGLFNVSHRTESNGSLTMIHTRKPIKLDSTFESQYGSGSRWDLSGGDAPVELVTRDNAPTNNDIFPSTWHEVASDSVVEFYSSMGVSL